MSQQSVRQAARRSALDAQPVLRKQRADRERRLAGLAVEVLTALRARDGAVRNAERRAGEALRTMRSARIASQLDYSVRWMSASQQSGSERHDRNAANECVTNRSRSAGRLDIDHTIVPSPKRQANVVESAGFRQLPWAR
jgi:hypothetical protein